MKLKTLSILLALVISAGNASAVLAYSTLPDTKGETSRSSTLVTKSETMGSDDDKSKGDETVDKDDNTSNDDNMSDEHRSTVSTFVKKLLSVADREGGIGKEVREVARSQNDSATTTATAIDKVQKRSSVKTFLIGTDYKNLGVIRSELANTSKNIEKLKTLLAKTTIPADKTDLENQIKALEAEQTKVTKFVSDHEKIFSLFGWFSKLFVK